MSRIGVPVDCENMLMSMLILIPIHGVFMCWITQIFNIVQLETHTIISDTIAMVNEETTIQIEIDQFLNGKWITKNR